MAMWSLIVEKTSFKDEDLFAKIREIDLADGVEDGKITKTCQKCPACGRTMSERHKKCLYCGAMGLIRTPFETI
jgi:ribosomal protein S27AE